MKNQAYRMTMLFAFYGDLLTDRRFHETKEIVAQIRGICQELDALNGRRFRDELLNGLCRRLDEAVTQLERE